MQCRGSLLHGGSWEWYISASILGSIPGTEQDSFERRERHARISPTRYRQFQLPIVIYEAIQLFTVCGAFCYGVLCTGVRPMGPLYATLLDPNCIS